LEEDFKGKDIAFVSISVDRLKDYDKWKKMVHDKAMKGHQLFADKSWNSDFVQAYQIKGIPTFILIDKDGKIISASAKRPSNPELKKQLEELLK
jgi:thioredoxin-related protein